VSALSVAFVRGSHFDYTFHLCRIVLDHPITVQLDAREHTDYRWATPSEALSLPFMEDLDSYLPLHYADKLSRNGT